MQACQESQSNGSSWVLNRGASGGGAHTESHIQNHSLKHILKMIFSDSKVIHIDSELIHDSSLIHTLNHINTYIYI